MSLSAAQQISTMLEEYRALRQELQSCFQIQMTTITVGASMLGILMTFGLNLILNLHGDIIQQIVCVFLFAIFIPCIISFLGIIWLDQTYRQVKTGTYIAMIEEKINKVANNNCVDFPLLYWEHWTKEQVSHKTFLNRISLYYYYICCGLFYFLPIVSVVLWQLAVRPALTESVVGIVGFLLIYLAFSFFSKKMIAQIMTYSEMIEHSTGDNIPVLSHFVSCGSMSVDSAEV